MMLYHYQPLIVIGAARSGTKLIRDLIAAHPDVDRVPYDINYIWRLENEDYEHDELPPNVLTSEIHQRILDQITRSYSKGAPFLIEKTVSNCLRVPFVYKAFPNAYFLHLVRDGRDVIESAYRQWQAPPDWDYIFQKARSFPLRQASGYALKYAKTALHKLLVKDNSALTWGPRYEGIDADVATKDLLEVCAIQWVRSIETAISDLAQIPHNKVLRVRYEDLVMDPAGSLVAIARTVGLDPAPYASGQVLQTVSDRHIGKGFANLDEHQRNLVMPYIENTLTRLEYI